MEHGLKRKPEAFLQACGLRRDQQLHLSSQWYKSHRGPVPIVLCLFICLIAKMLKLGTCCARELQGSLVYGNWTGRVSYVIIPCRASSELKSVIPLDLVPSCLISDQSQWWAKCIIFYLWLCKTGCHAYYTKKQPRFAPGFTYLIGMLNSWIQSFYHPMQWDRGYSH